MITARDPVEAAQDALYDALATVEGLRVVREYGQVIYPPAAAIDPPRLTWGGPGSDPTDATFDIAVMVANDDRVRTEAHRWRRAATEALHANRGCVVRSAEMRIVPAGGGTELPAYVLQVDYAL